MMAVSIEHHGIGAAWHLTDTPHPADSLFGCNPIFRSTSRNKFQMQEGPVSKTDEVLVLLNRLAANFQENPELSSNRNSQRRHSASHLSVTVNTVPPDGFLHGIKASLHKPWATATELGNAIYGKPIQEESPKSSAIRVVLGEQTSSQYGRKLRCVPVFVQFYSTCTGWTRSTIST